MKTIAAILLCLFALSACSAVRIQYGEATVTSFRLFEDQNLEGLKVTSKDGVSVSIDKKSNEAQTEFLSAAIAAYMRSLGGPLPVVPAPVAPAPIVPVK
jgi:hypothetical protein